MAKRGKSFSVNMGGLDKILSDLRHERERADKLIFRKVTKAVEIIYRVAHAKRPMITKAQMKREGRRVQVSNPEAEAGVPVRSGALQASIQKGVSRQNSKVTGKIWTDSPYAAFIEWGTSRMAARPFLRPAIALTRDALKQMFDIQEDA